MVKPRIGDTVQHEQYSGVVDWIGSSQFGFTDTEAEVIHPNGRITKGFRVMCLFNQEYKIVKRKPISKRAIKEKIRAKKQRVNGGVHGRRQRRRKTTRNSSG